MWLALGSPQICHASMDSICPTSVQPLTTLFGSLDLAFATLPQSHIILFQPQLHVYTIICGHQLENQPRGRSQEE